MRMEIRRDAEERFAGLMVVVKQSELSSHQETRALFRVESYSKLVLDSSGVKLFVRRVLKELKLHQLHPVVFPQSRQRLHVPFCFIFIEPHSEHSSPVKPWSFACWIAFPSVVFKTV